MIGGRSRLLATLPLAWSPTLSLAFSLCAFAVVACGKVSPNLGADGGGNLTIAEACSMLGQTECAKRQSCSNGANIKRVFGDMNTCVARETLLCTDALHAPGTGNSPALIQTCIADYAGLACNDYFDGKFPASCTPAGSVATGQPCGALSSTTFTQCLAGSCFSSTGTVSGAGATGTCKADVTEGAACDYMLGPFCQMPSRCVPTGGGTAGLCMLANGTCG